MNLKHKVGNNGRTERVVCPHWLTKPVRQYKDGRLVDASKFCSSREFEVIGEMLPNSIAEVETMDGFRFLQLKCLDCGGTTWKLIEKDVVQDEVF